MTEPPLLEVRGLRVAVSTAEGSIVAVDRLDLDVHARDIVGLIGESGSGKTTAVRALLGLLGRNVHIVAGQIRFEGRVVYEPGQDRRSSIRGRKVGMIFQSAVGSLNPLLTIRSQLNEVLHANRPDLDESAEARMTSLMTEMGFQDPERVLRSYPHQLSGGMRQRAAIALALAPEPKLVIADECTSSLDVTTQAEVVRLLRRLNDELGVAMIFVTHNLLLAAEICSRIVVLYGGQLVEAGTVGEVLRESRHPYTQALLRSVPGWEGGKQLIGIPGMPPRVQPGFVGCRFAARCTFVVEACSRQDVELTVPADGHSFRCILPDASARASDREQDGAAAR